MAIVACPGKILLNLIGLSWDTDPTPPQQILLNLRRHLYNCDMPRIKILLNLIGSRRSAVGDSADFMTFFVEKIANIRPPGGDGGETPPSSPRGSEIENRLCFRKLFLDR